MTGPLKGNHLRHACISMILGISFSSRSQHPQTVQALGQFSSRSVNAPSTLTIMWSIAGNLLSGLSHKFHQSLRNAAFVRHRRLLQASAGEVRSEFSLDARDFPRAKPLRPHQRAFALPTFVVG